MRNADTTDVLTTDELEELKKDFDIPAEAESVSLEEFQQAIGKWLTK
jgi:hypothetical protein